MSPCGENAREAYFVHSLSAWSSSRLISPLCVLSSWAGAQQLRAVCRLPAAGWLLTSSPVGIAQLLKDSTPPRRQYLFPACYHHSVELVFVLIKTTILIFFNFARIKKRACACHPTRILCCFYGQSLPLRCATLTRLFALINWKHYYGEISLFFLLQFTSF